MEQARFNSNSAAVLDEGRYRQGDKIDADAAILKNLVALGRHAERPPGELQEPGIWRNVAVLSTGSAAAHLITLLGYPILTRIYSPADFGTAAVFASVLSILALAATLRLEFVLTLPKEEVVARSLLWVCLVLACSVSFLLFILLFAFRNLETGMPKLAVVLRLWWVVPLALLALAAYQSFTYWAIRRRDYSRLARTKLYQAFSGAAVSILLGMSHPGPFGLVLGSAVNQSAGFLTLARCLSWNSFFEELSAGVKVARSYLGIAAQAAGASLLNTSSVILPPILLAILYDNDTAGAFGLAQRIVLLPMALIGATVGQVFLGEASRISPEDPSHLSRLCSKIINRMFPLGLGLGLSGGVLVFVFPSVFGVEWQTAGGFAAILAVSGGAQLVVSPVSPITLVRRRQDLQLRLDVLRVVLVAFSLCIPACLGLSAFMSITCFSLGMAIVYCATYFVCRHLAKQIPNSVRDVSQTKAPAGECPLPFEHSPGA